MARFASVGGYLLSALLVIVTVAQLMYSRGSAEREAEQVAASLARVLAAQTEAAITTIDQAMEHVVDATRGRTAGVVASDASLRALLVNTVKRVPFISAMYVIDAEGNVLQTSRPAGFKAFNASDREYFQFHRDHKGISVFVGSPIISRPVGKWSIPLSRRLEAPDGTFGGVVLAGLDPEYLQELYDGIEVGDHGVVSLISAQGHVMVRRPHLEALRTMMLPASGMSFGAYASGAKEGVQRGPYVTDGRIRIVGWRMIATGPLMIRVGLDEAEALASWRQGALVYGLAIAGFSVALAMMIALFQLQLGRRERAELALRQSEVFAHSTIDALPAPLCVLDGSGTILVTNRAWQDAGALPGAPYGGACCGTDYLDMCTGFEAAAPGDVEAGTKALTDGLRAVMSGTRAEHIQDCACDGPEGRRWYIGRVNRFGSEGAVRVVVIYQDVTERHRIEECLRESERRLAKAQSIAKLGNWELDLASGVVWWSDEVHQIFGRGPREFSAGFNDYLRFVHPDDRISLYEQERRLVADGTPMNVDHRIVMADGTSRVVNLQAELVPDSDGVYRRAAGIIHDITERKQAELALRTAVQETAIANRTKTEFLASMSHELNTPLNAVIGFSEMMEEEVLGPLGLPRYKEFSKIIHESGRRLQQLIADILDITKIESGEIDLDEEALDLSDLIAERVAQVRFLFENSGVDLCVKGVESGLGLVADRRMVKQILRNLLSNAQKFTPAGGSATVSAWRLRDRGICVSIEDTGVGMAPEDIPRALDRFSQIDGTLSREHDGAGLGLSLAKLMAEKHGGSVEVVSAVGRGTRVTVYFPADRVLDLEIDDAVQGTDGRQRSMVNYPIV